MLDIADYTDSATRELLLHSGTHGLSLPDYPWYHPTGWMRKDAYDPTSADPALHTIDLDKVRAQVLDPHDVTFGIATPDHIGGGALRAARTRCSRPSSRARTTTGCSSTTSSPSRGCAA